MANLSNPEFDLSDQRIWSLRSAEIPFVNGNKEPDYHCFLMLAEDDRENPGKFRILDELHFIPVNRKGTLFGATTESDEGPERPGVPFLGANSYTNPRRNLEEVATIPYATGTPRQILHIWNNAFRSALRPDAKVAA